MYPKKQGPQCDTELMNVLCSKDLKGIKIFILFTGMHLKL